MAKTFEEYWQALCQRNEGLRDESNTMKHTVANFKSALRQAWDLSKRNSEEKKGTASDLFGDMFK